MFDFDLEEKKRDEDMQRSEAIVHMKREQDLTAEKLPEEYLPHWSERDVQTRPRELFNMGNSYGSVSVAVNRRREMFLTVGQKRQHDSETLDSGQKILNGERRRTVPGPIGRAYTNSFAPGDSAFAFKTGKLQPPKRLLAAIEKYVAQHGQDTVETVLPFFSLNKDRKKLQALISKIGHARKEGEDVRGLERGREQLSRAISLKEQMRSRFLKKMEFARKKARLVTEATDIAWLDTAAFTAGISAADTPPEDAGDLTEGLPGSGTQENEAGKK